MKGKNKTEIQRVIRDNIENLYTTKQEHLEEMDKSFYSYKLPTLNQDDVEYLYRSITTEKN